MSNEFFGDGVVVHTIDTSSAVPLGGITGGRVATNTDTEGDEDGRDFDYARCVIRQMPEFEFSTKSIALLMAALPINGICLRTDGTHPGITAYARQRATCGPNSVAVASDDHMAYLFDTGLWVPESLSASRGTDAVATSRVHALTDGANAPFAFDPEVTLPAGLNTDKYVLGHMKIANVVFDDVRNLDVAFNVEIGEKLPELGGVWCDSVASGKARPVVTCQGRNPQRLNESTGINLLGKTATKANTIFYFKKKTAAGFVADATAEHLKMEVSGLCVWNEPFSFSGSSAATTSFRIDTAHDGTNVNIVFTPNVAYDTTP